MSILSLTGPQVCGVLGVNTHINWQNMPGWANAATYEAALGYLGVKHVRDIAPVDAAYVAGAPNILATYESLAKTYGIQFCIGPLTPSSFQADLAGVKSLLATCPGAVFALEGPNEVNNNKFTYGGYDSESQTDQFAVAVMAGIKTFCAADPVLAKLPIINLSFSGANPATVDLSAYADYGNWHPYAGTGKPQANLAAGRGAATLFAPSKPVVFTEAGYCGGTVDQWCSVSQPLQAEYTLLTWMEAAVMGVTRVYLYELMDNAPRGSTAGTTAASDSENAFGLFDCKGNPYPVATAIRNMMNILTDSTSPTGTAQPVAMVAGAAGSLAVAFADGSQRLVIWNEGGPLPATVNLDQPRTAMSLYDPIANTTTAVATNAAAATFTVPAYPVVLQISNKVYVAPPVAPPTPDEVIVCLAGDQFGAALPEVAITLGADGPHNVSVAALHGQGASQPFAFVTTWGGAAKTVKTEFLNDAYTPGSGDRNAYLQGASVNGQFYPPAKDGAMMSTGDTQTITIT